MSLEMLFVDNAFGAAPQTGGVKGKTQTAETGNDFAAMMAQALQIALGDANAATAGDEENIEAEGRETTGGAIALTAGGNSGARVSADVAGPAEAGTIPAEAGGNEALNGAQDELSGGCFSRMESQPSFTKALGEADAAADAGGQEILLAKGSLEAAVAPSLDVVGPTENGLAGLKRTAIAEQAASANGAKQAAVAADEGPAAGVPEVRELAGAEDVGSSEPFVPAAAGLTGDSASAYEAAEKAGSGMAAPAEDGVARERGEGVSGVHGDSAGAPESSTSVTTEADVVSVREEVTSDGGCGKRGPGDDSDGPVSSGVRADDKESVAVRKDDFAAVLEAGVKDPAPAGSGHTWQTAALPGTRTLENARAVAENLYREAAKKLPRSVEINMEPPMGKVTALLTQRGQDVTVKFVAHSEEARNMLAEAAPDLARALSEKGLTLFGLSVDQGYAGNSEGGRNAEADKPSGKKYGRAGRVSLAGAEPAPVESGWRAGAFNRLA